jgi:serine/threonine protein kinase
MIGYTLRHYRIESKLGQGGMGVVYKARDTKLGRPVAIKVLSAESVAHPGRKQRFIQEARAASALNHPSIITIYEIDAAEGVDFIAWSSWTASPSTISSAARACPSLRSSVTLSRSPMPWPRLTPPGSSSGT